MKKAVVLLSGGLDSTTILTLAHSKGYAPHCLSFNYGQRHSNEIKNAQIISNSLPFVVEHRISNIDLSCFNTSALTSEIEVPKNREVEISDEIPVTYVPARNTIFLAYALGYAETIGAHDIFIGVNSVDYSAYPDCRPEFISAFQALANMATKIGVEEGGIRIHAPLQYLDKQQIIQLGIELGVDYSLTTSCYDPPSQDTACGRCDACILRLKGFAGVGVKDPIKYANEIYK